MLSVRTCLLAVSTILPLSMLAMDRQQHKPEDRFWDHITGHSFEGDLDCEDLRLTDVKRIDDGEKILMFHKDLNTIVVVKATEQDKPWLRSVLDSDRNVGDE